MAAHAGTHERGGNDPIRLDDLAEPQDNIDLNANTLRHGLLPKLSGNSTDSLQGNGTWGSGGNAAASNHFVTTQAESGLSAEFSLGSLTTGMLKHTVSAGVSTPATATAATDYVAPGAVTTSGLTQATGKLLGRTTASTGAIEEITVGSGLTLTAGSLSASATGTIQVVPKTADESVTSSTALQNDNELLFGMGASQTWLVEITLLTISTVNTTGNIKVDFTLPASATIASWGGIGNLVSAGGTVDMTTVRNYGEVGAVTATAWVVNTVIIPLYLFALVSTAGTSGNFTLRWAQNTSSGNPTTVKAGSYLKATRVS